MHSGSLHKSAKRVSEGRSERIGVRSQFGAFGASDRKLGSELRTVKCSRPSLLMEKLKPATDRWPLFGSLIVEFIAHITI